VDSLDDTPLREIVSKNYRAAAVFDRYGLDYCCQGNRTLSDACTQRGIDVVEVIGALNGVDNTQDPANPIDWPLDTLVDHIQNKHHAYVEEKSPIIMQYLEKVCNVYGHRHPELLRINDVFRDIASDLAMHMKKEEFMVFPYIRRMVRARQDGTAASSPLFKSINSPVKQLTAEHADEGQKIDLIERLSGNFTAPEDACNTYRVTYALLKEFRDDLHRHIHLENNILFSKAIQLEAQLNA